MGRNCYPPILIAFNYATACQGWRFKMVLFFTLTFFVLQYILVLLVDDDAAMAALAVNTSSNHTFDTLIRIIHWNRLKAAFVKCFCRRRQHVVSFEYKLAALTTGQQSDGENCFVTHSSIRNLSPSEAMHVPRLLIVDPCISIVWGTPDWNHEPDKKYKLG